MRTGKSATVVWAAQFLFEAGKIDKVIIVAPAPVRNVWYDDSFGEIAKHRWNTTPVTVADFHSRIRVWAQGPEADKRLFFYISNFEYLRNEEQLKTLMEAAGPRTLLIGDESSFLNNWKSQQTKAFFQLRKRCGRCWLLNGTPIFSSPLNLFSQANILSPDILQCQFVTHFKARYAIQQPVMERGKPMVRYNKIVQEVADWTNLDDLERRLKPYTVRRLQAECLDLPPKLDPVTLTATLNESWKPYKQMRDDMVVWLSKTKVVNSKTAAIKALRLSQITGGFLRGAENANIDVDVVPEGESVEWGDLFSGEDVQKDLVELIGKMNADKQEGYTLEDVAEAQENRGSTALEKIAEFSDVTEVGREKLEVLLWLIAQLLEKDENIHVVCWSRFRPEVFRAEKEVRAKFPQFTTATVLGGQKRAEREAALALLKPETAPRGPVFVAGIEGTGSFGLDMTSAHTCITLSSGYSPGRSAQTLDRVYGPGQKYPVAYYNIVAVGPRGQRTIDHDILLARTTGENIAMRTAAAWVRALKDE